LRPRTLSVPFDNLDPRRGAVPTLDIDSLQTKLVQNRRSGYGNCQRPGVAAALSGRPIAAHDL
jgi:hypothetical protein